MKSFWKFYARSIKERPILTKSGTGLVLAFSGDLIAQRVEFEEKKLHENNKKFEINHQRLISFSLFGATWTGVANHYWLGYLNRRFPESVLKKLAVQQLFFGPFVYLPYFYGFNAIYLGMSFQELEQWMRREYFRTLISSWSMWTPINVILFWKVPERYQSVTMAACSLVWNGILSYMNN